MISLLATLVLPLSGCTDSAAEALLTCEGGNLEACYRDGSAAANAARPRYEDARKLFAKACMPVYRGSGKPKDNHPEACYSLGRLVRDAKGGPRDLPRAADVFEIACKGEVPRACVDLGLVVYDPPEGSEVTSEPERAVELFFTACNQVDAAPADSNDAHPLAVACDALGSAYEEGNGVENGKKDADRAMELYKKSCDARYAPGCVSAGALLASKKARASITEAAELFERGCKLDARHGCFELGDLHAKKRWPDASEEIAAEFYEKTCNIDPTRGCYEAAELMEQGKVESKDGKVESLYNLACEHGHTKACTKRNIQ
ncbi:MAG: sel1 repeat family protein [Myxococcales bacterium]|nr:sel1 repeat family protein [Myxococcales bacterium]